MHARRQGLEHDVRLIPYERMPIRASIRVLRSLNGPVVGFRIAKKKIG